MATTETRHAPPAEPPITAGELVAQGAAVIRIENETMMQVAVQRPRDEAAVIKGALHELELVPEEAGKAFYSIPYKDRQPDGSVKMTKVEGPSIKAAMALARRWGNCTTGARVLNEDKEGYDVEGVFIDLETNFRLTRPHRVSKWYKPRGGGAQLLDVSRQGMALQAGASKALRNAILGGLPAYLVSAYDKKARAIVGGKLDAPADAKTIKAVVDAFGKWKVAQTELERYTELPATQWTGTEVADLRGLWNAISDGQTTVEEVFRGGSGEPSSATGPVLTPETLLSGATTGENGADPGQAPSSSSPPTSAQESLIEGMAGAATWAPPDPGTTTLTTALMAAWEEALIAAPTRADVLSRWAAVSSTKAFKAAVPGAQDKLKRARDARLAEMEGKQP